VYIHIFLSLRRMYVHFLLLWCYVYTWENETENIRRKRNYFVLHATRIRSVFFCYFLLFAKVIGFCDSFQHYATIENKTQLLIQKNTDEKNYSHFVSKKEWRIKLVNITFSAAFLKDEYNWAVWRLDRVESVILSYNIYRLICEVGGKTCVAEWLSNKSDM
jgi:hypothetical protein